MSAKVPSLYECPRCGYVSQWKKNMKKHLFEKKKPCPNNKNLELTEEIKNSILLNYKYYPKKATRDSRNITYNNNSTNNYNSYVSGLETLEKLGHLLCHNNKNLVDINDFVESQHQDTVNLLIQDGFRNPHLIESFRFLSLVDDMVKVSGNNHEEMNIIYDEMLDRIQIWCDDEWQSFMIEPGLKRTVEILRTNYLDSYECYLYRKLFDDKLINAYQLNEVRIKLEEYYKFLAIFDHRPFVYDQPIEYVVLNYKTENPDEFRDYGMTKYREIKESLGKVEIAQFKRQVLDIIKRNHKLNLKKLNASVLDLINVDEDFRTNVMKLNI